MKFPPRSLRWLFTVAVATCLLSPGCGQPVREDLDYNYNVVQTWQLPELRYGEIVQFESVFWESDDTDSLRELICQEGAASGRSVLEIGTGTGLLSILCAQNNASRIVATDINPAAVACAKYNAAMHELESFIDVRKVPVGEPSAFAVIQPTERFDVILSNPPWEDGNISQPADHAFYDPGFALMDSILDGLPQHLNPGGRCLLAYGHRPAIERLREEVQRRGYQWQVLDDREIGDLESDFLPGMLVEIRLPQDQGF